ncbi:MAG: hypothetical protein JO021_10765, partial [Alphaproteobacteria bacterium]|nr:hypothetical protein [Alphaproteobacteria bacterium]
MTRVTVTQRLRRTVLALLILVMGAAGVVAQPQGGAPVAANAPPAVAPATPAFATARDAFGRKDYAAALKAFRQGADGGDASSMAGVGALYALGAGMPANDGEALRWFKKAAANDTSWAPEVNRLLNAGDLHTVYLTEPEMKELNVSTRGEFEGLGIEITLADGRPSVVAPIDDTPGARAGMQTGDVIVRINDA